MTVSVQNTVRSRTASVFVTSAGEEICATILVALVTERTVQGTGNATLLRTFARAATAGPEKAVNSQTVLGRLTASSEDTATPHWTPLCAKTAPKGGWDRRVMTLASTASRGRWTVGTVFVSPAGLVWGVTASVHRMARSWVARANVTVGGVGRTVKTPDVLVMVLTALGTESVTVQRMCVTVIMGGLEMGVISQTALGTLTVPTEVSKTRLQVKVILTVMK